MVVKFNKFGKKRAKFGNNSDFNYAVENGRTVAYLEGFVMLLISILLIIFGIYLLNKKGAYPEEKIFTVKTSKHVIYSTPSTVNGVTNTETFTYYTLTGTVPGCKETIKIPEYRKLVKPGETIKVWTKPGCLNSNVVTNPQDYKEMGWSLLVIGFFISIFPIINIYNVTKDKDYAAAESVPLFKL